MGNDHFNTARQLQVQYWRFNRQEFEQLQGKLKSGTTWSQRLRLLHLCCAAMIESSEGVSVLNADEFSDDAAKHPLAGLTAKLAGMLLGATSPFRARNAMLWQGMLNPEVQRPPDLGGHLLNPSLSHLGCVEVLRLKDESIPNRLEFVPLHAIKGLYMATPGLFRAARLMEENGRDEVVWLPALYGLSWRSRQSFDTDGTMTRFVMYTHEAASGRDFGIGIGQQDWEVIQEQGHQLVGINSVCELDMPIDVREAGWEAIARGRGIDPQEVRRQLGLS